MLKFINQTKPNPKQTSSVGTETETETETENETEGPPPPPPFFLYLSYTAPHAGGVGTNAEGQPPVPRISSGPYEGHAADLGKEIG